MEGQFSKGVIIAINAKKKQLGFGGIFAREGYEAVTGLRALERAGQNPQLKGIVHELMFCDRYNANPLNIISGNHAALTQSTTARMRDVVMTNGGKIVGHAQLKDTVSASGGRKTIEQIRSGHYNKTAIFGTEETTRQVAGKVSQNVRSSGISSETTSRIAGKALGRMPKSGVLGAAARSGGASGAIFGAGVEAISSAIDVVQGKKKVGDALIDVGGAAVKGGIAGAGSAVAGSAAAPVAVGFAAACAVGSFISSFFD